MYPAPPTAVTAGPFVVSIAPEGDDLGEAWSTDEILSEAHGERAAEVLAWIGDVVGLARWQLSDAEVRYTVWFSGHFREQKGQADHRGKVPSDRVVEQLLRSSDEYLEHHLRIADAQRALEAAQGVRDAVRFITRQQEA